MIRTTSTFRVPILRLVGTLLTLAALVGLPTGAWAEFRIGVWQPAGHLASDVSFNHITVADLNSLGVDLLINTPNRVGITNGRYQLVEESILSQWNDAGKGFVVQHAPEGHSRRGSPWKLERYAGSLCDTRMTNRDRALHNPMWLNERNDLGEAARLLWNKWRTYPGFYGYRIGHETDYCGGIYDSRTYDNMSTVIDSIRAYDTQHRIIAVGNTLDTRWTAEDQAEFRQNFFRPNTIPGGPDPSPANIFMQEVYILADGDDSEDEVQARFNWLRGGLDSIGTMVDLALSENRKAEWHFIVQVSQTDRIDPAQEGLYRHPTLPELKAQVNMALSRGATGVTYFLYTSSNGPVSNYEYTGLVDLNRKRAPIWNTVRTVNNTLRTLGDALNPLTWDAGFPSNRLSNATLVDAVRPSANHAATAGQLEFGVFHDDEADYVLVVNRHNLTITTDGSQTIDLRLDTRQMLSDHADNGSYCVAEIVTDVEQIHAADDSGHLWITQQTFAPGDARLYRIEQVEVPRAPQNLIAKEADEAVRLTWKAPASDGGTPITGYAYRYSADDGTTWQPSETGGELDETTFYDHTIDNLTNGTEYTFEVWARNKVGNGAAMSVKATPAGVPHTPVLQAFGENGRIGLNIKLVADNGSPITRTETRVYSVSHGDTTWRTTKGRTTKGTWEPHSIDPNPSIYPTFFDSGQTVSRDSLTNGVTYTSEVRSVNGVGTSAIALTKATAGHTTWLSGGLLPLTASGGAGQVVLNWTPGAGWQVAQYEVQSRVARSGDSWSVWSPVPGGSAARDTTVAGLLNGTEYEFMVRAVNEKGVPLAASNVVLATPADRPGEPVLTAAGGDGQVVLDWTAAAAHGSALVRYEMRGRVADSGHGWPEWSPVPGGGSARDTTVAGLLNGTEYEFAVRAVNGVGAGVAALDSATPQGSSTLAVSFGSATYAAQEGGAGVSIGVGLSPSSSQPVHIPVVAAADADTEAGDYTVSGLSAGAVVFAAGASSSSFTIAANEDADRDDETVSVSFGTLPAGVVAVGTTRQATVTLRDNDGFVTPLAVRDLASRSTGLTSGQASWNPPRNAVEAQVGSYRYRLDGGTIQTTTTTSASFSALQPGRRYLVDVWAVGSGGAGPIATTTFTTESGVAPVLASVGPLDCYVGEYCSFTFPVAQKGTEPITYTVSPPSWAKASGRSFSGTAPSSPGTASASLNASNAYGTDSESLTINIEKRTVAGVAPVLDPVGPLDCYVGEYCSFTFPAATRGTEPITYTVSPPSWAKASGRSFSGTAPSSPGTASASLNASNAYGMDSESLTINIEKRTVAGVAPVLASVGPLDCYVGEYCSFTFPVAKKGTEPITYRVSPPSWAKASGRGFAGTAPSSPGTASASLNASNAYGTDSESLTINVKKRGYRPVLASVSSVTCYVGEYCSFTFPAATSGTAPITYKVSPPSWAKASGSRGFAGTAPSSPGTASASLNASNAYGTDSESVTIKVQKRGYPPVLASVSSITCYVGEYCSFTFPAATSGTAPITYKVSPPSWAKASGSRGFAGAAPSSPGTFSASISASNAYGTDSESLTIKVQRRLAIAPGVPSAPSTAAGFGIGVMALRLSMPARRPKNPS